MAYVESERAFPLADACMVAATPLLKRAVPWGFSERIIRKLLG